uniref:Uncharacterized protein n=1 Tax=Rhizophagus irregularis (strain DAOM 181602 / DAOM 197198 / MUCL 43194) TaxID=747089 RepID=U9U862_RHIID
MSNIRIKIFVQCYTDCLDKNNEFFLNQLVTRMKFSNLDSTKVDFNKLNINS